MDTNENEEKMANKACCVVALAAILLGVIILCTSCKSVKVDGGSHDKDSTKIEYRIDTCIMYVKDSVTIQLPCSDSIEVAYVDRYHTEVKYVKKEIHDTISVCSMDSIPYPVEVEVEKEVKSKFDHFTEIWFYVTASLLIGAILALIARAIIKAYLHV